MNVRIFKISNCSIQYSFRPSPLKQKIMGKTVALSVLLLRVLLELTARQDFSLCTHLGEKNLPHLSRSFLIWFRVLKIL